MKLGAWQAYLGNTRRLWVLGDGSTLHRRKDQCRISEGGADWAREIFLGRGHIQPKLTKPVAGAWKW